MKFDIESIGVVRGGRVAEEDDHWGSVEATIELGADRFTAEATQGLSDFSHVTVVFLMHKVPEEKIVTGARHPRERSDWPKVGIFAQPGRMRPNRIGVTTCDLIGVDGTRLRVRGLDAIDGTPVLDLKPYISGFAPRGRLREPDWIKP
jgi:tRNA-Thr(GGU) m(6)t(6)A37 methyltransferase TsaA